MGLTMEPKEWAERQFGSALLGDVRRSRRAAQLGAAMMSNSAASLPKQTGTWSSTIAAYRLLNAPEVTHAGLSTPHWTDVRARARKFECPVLFIQDMTELNYNGHHEATGLGFASDGKGKALEVQSALCVSGGARAEVLGLGYQVVWAREHEPRKKTEKRSERDARRKESDVWGDVLEAIGPAGNALWVSVGDRESDIFSYMDRARSLGWHCLIRAKHNRNVAVSEGVNDHLFDHVRSLPALATTELHLRSRPGHAARDVVLNVAWTTLAIQTPQRCKGVAVDVWCVRVWEDAPSGLEWILLSTIEVSCARDALEKVEWYRRRWLVEEYHKCLKTGCSMEERQSRTRHALEAVLGLLSIVAVFLLQLKFAEDGEIPDGLQLALCALTKRDISQASPREILREIAKLGGFLARKGDGEPGWQTIWYGWSRLQDILLGMQIVLAGKCV
jgi:hypothetical protein